MSLKGKHALVTGSSRGIGRGIALKLAENGAKVAVHYYVNEAAAKETLAQVRKRDSDGFIVQADVSRPEDVKRMFYQVRPRFGTLDVFVSNARTEIPTFYQAPMEITLEKWDTAMDSHALSPGFTEDSVVNSLPSEVQDMIRGWHESGWTPLRRLGTPADVGNAVTLLCSEEAGWITGQVIDVDGGASVVNPGLPLEIQRG
jgi:NAD(P)-dependent dehydrogenase (short-subunit alcohol dehydrogenase family)